MAEGIAGGIVAHDGLLNPGFKIRQRGQRRSVANEEQYRITLHTHQKNVTSFRFDLFADKSLPQRGPGLNGDGSFQLVELKVSARPLDPMAKDTPLELKLKAVFAAFEDKDQPLSNALDGKPATAWVVRDREEGQRRCLRVGDAARRIRQRHGDRLRVEVP